MQDVSDTTVATWRQIVGAPGKDASLEEYVAWMDDIPAGPALIIQDADPTTAEEQIEIENARQVILAGVGNEVAGRVQVVEGLLRLKKDDLWKKDPLVIHLEEPKWKEDYLAELIEWLKEENPAIQAGLSTLQNYLKYYQAFVEGYGFPKELVFGATEHTRRALYRMAKWGYGGGLPEGLRNGYDVDKLPQPAYFKGDESTEERITEGMRIVSEQAFSLGRYSPDLFKAYEAGDGGVKTSVSMVIKLSNGGTISDWTAFVQQQDANGEPLASFATNLLTQEMPCEVLDWLERHGFQVEMDA